MGLPGGIWPPETAYQIVTFIRNKSEASAFINGILSSERKDLTSSLNPAVTATLYLGKAHCGNSFNGDIGVRPFAYFALGKAAEIAKQRDSALAAYGQFLRLWSKADSLGQPRVQEAKDAVARLTKEKT